MIDHSLSGAYFHARGVGGGAVAPAGRRLNSRQIAEAPVGVAEKEGVGNRAALPLIHLKFHQRLARHARTGR